MNGLTRDEWLKISETIQDAPRGTGNVVIPLAHQMTPEERVADADRIGKYVSKFTSSGTDAEQHQQQAMLGQD